MQNLMRLDGKVYPQIRDEIKVVESLIENQA